MSQTSSFSSHRHRATSGGDYYYAETETVENVLKHLMPVKFTPENLADEIGTIETFSSALLESFEATFSSNVFEAPEDVPPRDTSRYTCTVVFDLDETLIYAREGNRYCIRPFARVLLEFLKKEVEGVEVLVWSAGSRPHVECCLSLLDPTKDLFSYAICRGEWTSTAAQNERRFKNLKHLSGRCMNTTILLDDSFTASGCNDVGNVIVLPKFEPNDENFENFATDLTLFFVLQLLAWLYIVSSKSEETFFSLKEQITNHPFVVERRERKINFVHIVLDVNDFMNFEKRALWWKSGGGIV